MFDESLKAQLKAYLDRVIRSIHIHASVDESHKSREMLDLLENIVLLSGKKVVLEVHRDDDQRKPSFGLGTPGESISIRFAGLPMGHEFASLVLGLLQVGGHPPKVADDLIERVRNLDGHYRFETYFSVSCQSCPDVVQALNMAAVLNPQIEHVAIDGALFQDEVEARQIMSVPTVYLNGELFGQGRMTLEQIVAKLDSGAAKRTAESIQAKAAFDVLVVGAGPAGTAAAVYAARKGVRTGLVAERFGGQVLDTMTIENFISVPETDGPRMVAALEQHVRQYEVDIMNLQRVETLVPAGENGFIEVRLASGASLSSRTVILSTGAHWRQMNVPGEDEYRNKGVAYCPHCDGPLFKGKHVAVIGGGNSGVEAAIDLAGIASYVTLLEFDTKLRADEVLQRKLRSMSNVEVIMGAQTTEVRGDGKKVTGLVYVDRSTGGSFTLALEGVFVQIGLLPNTEWLKGRVELSPRGEIVVDECGHTSLPGVFAAGDATTVPYKQIVIAMGEGSKAALSAFDYLIRNVVEITGIAQAQAA
ncbi:alkyl hydroperoxide reductase subunit F [Xylella fastidiosa]|uniref:Alkyl hydroperoxide reductase subunit F n=1 Tax=Xylella fastidiosa TaxID=2371 RepID=A0ABC8ACY2_XYLFS|nr:alkyl hydroperoxide reductase subunit F [Xylella fastidiosa]ALR06227.1 alkyl hydroperoxide reductase subunit F [Xylella fastidiosa]